MRHRGHRRDAGAWPIALVLTLGLAACGSAEDTPAPVDSVDETPAAAVDTPAPPDASSTTAVGTPASAGAPAFAVVYPGGAVAPEATDAAGAARVIYSVAATPDQVLDFYQAEADKAGLSPVMALRQGERGGFGAMSATTGESLDVWAESAEAGQTRVTLNWHAGGGA